MSRPGVLVVPSHPAVRALGLVVLVLLVVLVASARAGAAGVPDQGPGEGQGVVEGVVRDQRGAPVAGAAIRVDTGPDGYGYGFFPYVREAVSDAEGRYRVEGIVAPSRPPTDDGRALRVSRDGYATEGVVGVVPRLQRLDGTPVRADVVLRDLDVVLRGRIAVRGGASVERGGVTATLATRPGGTPGPFDHWSTETDADGRWELRVPAGSYRLTAGSRFGLLTRWPDLAPARPAPATRVAGAGETIDGLDVSMRPRMRDAARDEFGTGHEGWDVDPETGRSVRTSTEPYARDTYRSVTSPNGPAVGFGRVLSSAILFPGLPAEQLLTVTGIGLPVEVPITNTGDDVLWLGTVRAEGAFVLGASCRYELGDCAGQHLMPGETKTVSVTVLTVAHAPEYHVSLVVPYEDGREARLALVQRNVSDPDLAPGDQGLFDALIRYLPPENQAIALLGARPAEGQAAKAAGIGAVVVRRSSVRVAFPAAGRVDVRVDRRTAARGRTKARWSPVRSVRLKATRAGTRTARIRPLARGRYRIRATLRMRDAPVRRGSVVRTVSR